MGSESSTPFPRMQLDARTFRLFLHDVHHAYLLLHRACLQLPPTVFPTLEPMPLPCHVNLSQQLLPLNPTSRSPRTKKKRTTKCLFSPRTNSFHILLHRPSSPVQFVMYLHRTPRELPMPSAMPSKSPLRSPPDPTRRHRRTTKPRKDKEPADRRPSRSRSPMTSPRPWTEDGLNRLKDLKGNTTEAFLESHRGKVGPK